MVSLLLYPVSLIPVILIYRWLTKKVLEDEERQKLGKQALINGLLVIIPAIIAGIVLSLFNRVVLKLNEDTDILSALLYNFFIIALPEELSKGFMMQRLLKKHNRDYSWLDVIVYMMIVAIGFDILESAFYLIMSGPAQVIVRGITLPHLAYGFIMGYFAGKAMKTGNKMLYVPAVIIPWIFHGTYDFSLTKNLLDASEVAPVVALALALFELVFAIVALVSLNKKKKNAEYTEIILHAKA